MRILIINFTRLGDILQSQAGISDLQEAGHEVALVCLENFMAATTLMRGLAHVFPFPGTHLLRSLAYSANKDDSFSEHLPVDSPEWPSGLACLQSWQRATLEQFCPNAIINMTPTLSARLLGRVLVDAVNQKQGEGLAPSGLPAPPSMGDNSDPLCQLYGYSLDSHGFGVNSDGWTTMLQGVKGNRLASAFNVVDIFRRILTNCLAPGSSGTGNSALLPPSAEAMSAIDTRLAAQKPSGCRGFVAFQLGASEERRQWPASSFARLGDDLWKNTHHVPVLVGTASETPLVAEYSQCANHPFLSLCGETSIPSLGALLCRSSLLVTNDTGTMHLAAGLGVPVLGIFLATAQPFDTGPYLAGACSVEPDLDCHPCAFGEPCPKAGLCRTIITPETLAVLARHVLEQGCFPARPSGNESGVRIWLCHKDSNGLAGLSSLCNLDASERAAWMHVQRHWLNAFMTHTALPEMHDLSLSLTPETARSILEDCVKIKALLELVTGQGQLLTLRPSPPMREKFLATWAKVHRSFLESPWLGTFGLLWMHDTQQEQEELAKVLAIMTRYKDWMEGAVSVLESALQVYEI